MIATSTTLCLAFVALCCWRLYSNWSQLSHVPGPRLAGLSDFWRAWYQRRGKLRGKLVELHSQYGPVVRYGVRSVSFNDPSAVDVVFGTRAGFVIADSYKVLVGVSHGKEVNSLITLADEQRHNTLRRSVANAFTSKMTLDYEPHIDRTIEELLAALGRKPVLNLSQTMSFFGLDAASGFAFNTPKGCLAADADLNGTITLIRNRGRHWSRWGSLPALERLLHRNPIAMRMKAAAQSGMVTAAISTLKARTEKPLEDSQTPDLLTRFLDALQKNPDTLSEAGVVGLLMSTISAASDTTSTAMTATLFHLMKNPTTLAKLHAELDAANLSRPIPTFAETSKLPYLHATLREGMRLFPALAHPIERLVPTGGAEIVGTFLPPGTSVGCLQLAMHLNPKVFGPDAEVFRPERWLEASAEQLRVMDTAHVGFGKGRRVCIGQNTAVMEMKKVVPAMLLGFDMSLDDPDARLDGDFEISIISPRALFVRMRARG